MKYTDKLENAIKLYLHGLSLQAAAKTANVSYSSLQLRIKNLNLTRSNKTNSRKYFVDHNFFENINSEIKAYWLGFMYADGYISNRGSQKLIGVAIGTKDKNHLTKFVKHLKSNYQIKEYTANSGYSKNIIYNRLLMTSETMFNDLLKQGLTEHKSLTLKFPSITKKLERHFIRGYFDGDGSFAKAVNGYNIKICGTKEFLTAILNIFQKNKLKLHQRNPDKDKNNYYLTIGGMQQVKHIADYLYKESTVYLDRKHTLYEIIKSY